MANGIGTFLAHWTVGNAGMSGAPIVNISAVVAVAPVHRINGQARLTQATNPPLDTIFDMTGTYHDAPIPGGERHFIALRSVPSPLAGAPSLEVLMELNQDWQTGTATFSYMIGSTHNTIRNVPVKATASAAGA